jgi:manganese transport protein
MTVLPFLKKQTAKADIKLHGPIPDFSNLTVPEIKLIAAALDFSVNDEKIIAHALQQGKKEASYLLLHIVESAPARMLGDVSDDFETRNDRERLQQYAQTLKEKGFNVTIALGYKNRIKEIVRIVKDNKANLLVMGAHRHKGLKDYVFGETIEAVRHELEIPVFIVNV